MAMRAAFQEGFPNTSAINVSEAPAAVLSGKAWRGKIHYAPWPLQLEIRRNTMLALLEIDVADQRLQMHFAKRLNVVAWRPVGV